MSKRGLSVAVPPRVGPLLLPMALPLILLLAMSARAAQAAPVTVSDDRGRAVQLAAPPQRIVSLLPSLTETICELGACAQLVGTDRYSNYPASVQKLPKLGGLDDTSVEALIALRPDVVLLGLSSRLMDRLEALGVKVVALEPKSLGDVQRVLGTVGQLLGRPDEARRSWNRIDGAISQSAAQLPAAARGLSVYYEVDAAPYAVGSASFLGEILARLGARNIVPAELGPFPKLNPEFIVRADPQLIMVGQRGAAGLAERPGWGAIRAVRAHRICVWTLAESDVLARPGPRIAEAAALLARCLREAA
ncbi:MAG: helical backbone metal receptor, partial [Burkholderiaceae bacterium]